MKLKRKKGFHRHHKIPKHMGGSDELENLEYLTPEEHAEAHLKLYKEFGKYEDILAYNNIVSRWLCGRIISGFKQSKEHIEKRRKATDYEAISRKLKGKQSPTKGMTFVFSEERKKNISESLKGKKFSEERKKNISKGMIGKEPSNKMENYCIHCRKRVPLSRLDRHGSGKKACVRNG